MHALGTKGQCNTKALDTMAQSAAVILVLFSIEDKEYIPVRMIIVCVAALFVFKYPLFKGL